MAGDAVVGFEVWMEVIALDVESDGLQMLLAVTGSYWQLLAVTAGSYTVTCSHTVTGSYLLAVTGGYWQFS